MKRGHPKRYLTPEQYMRFASAVTEHRGARCLVALVLADRKPLVSSGLLPCRVPYDSHHLVPQRVLARHVPAEALLSALTDVRGGIVVCRRHHDMLEGCAVALEPDEWPADAWEFAAAYGLSWFIEKKLERRLVSPADEVVTRQDDTTTARGSGLRPAPGGGRRGHPMSGKHVVMFSGGVGSWMTAERVAAEHGTDGLVLLFADTLMEDEDTYRFLDAAAEGVGGELVRLADGRDIWQVFRDSKFLGNTRIDPCSRILKRELMRRWVNENCDPEATTIYLGIDWTEAHRATRYERYWQPYAVRCPLTEPPYLTKAQMLVLAAEKGLPTQRLYEWGFHHANCGGGCVKAGQAQFELLLRRLPERYAEWERNEEIIRAELGKDVTILRDRRIVHGREVVTPITLRAFRERLEARPGLFDAEEWGGCACTNPSDEELVA